MPIIFFLNSACAACAWPQISKQTLSSQLRYQLRSLANFRLKHWRRIFPKFLFEFILHRSSLTKIKSFEKIVKLREFLVCIYLDALKNKRCFKKYFAPMWRMSKCKQSTRKIQWLLENFLENLKKIEKLSQNLWKYDQCGLRLRS